MSNSDSPLGQRLDRSLGQSLSQSLDPNSLDHDRLVPGFHGERCASYLAGTEGGASVVNKRAKGIEPSTFSLEG